MTDLGEGGVPAAEGGEWCAPPSRCAGIICEEVREDDRWGRAHGGTRLTEGAGGGLVVVGMEMIPRGRTRICVPGLYLYVYVHV